LVVEVSRFARYVSVSKSKITVPSVVRSKYVAYRSEASPLTTFLIVFIFALSIASIGLIGFSAVMFLTVSLLILWYFESRRRGREVADLRSVLPEDKVFEILGEVARVCGETRSGSEVLHVGGFMLRARCGTPYKCVKYDSRNLRRLTLLYASVGLALVLSYAFLSALYLLLVSIASLFIIIYTSRVRVCEEFLVKKEKIELEVGS